MIGKYVTNTYDITESYKKIFINAKNAKVKIEQSNDNNTKLVIFEKKRSSYEFFVQDDTLTIKLSKTRWYNFLRVGIDHSEVLLYVPKKAFEAILVKSNVGHVNMSSINCSGTIEIKINTGKINLKNVCCNFFDSKGNTGSAILNNVNAKRSLTIKRNTGKVILNDCSASEIYVKTNTGKVCGKLPSNMVFTTFTNTGKIVIPKAPIGLTIGGRCEIRTNTGSIKFE